jgi:hypothetical protein
VSWSRSHCELLLSGGADRTVRVWNLRLEPHCLVHTHDRHTASTASSASAEFHSSVVGVGWSPTHPLQYVGAGADGELCAFGMTKGFVSTLCNYHTQSRHTVAAPTALPGVPVLTPSSASSALTPSAATTATSAPATASGGGVAAVSEAQRKALERGAAQEKEIERLLYLRDFEQSFKQIAVLAAKYWDQSMWLWLWLWLWRVWWGGVSDVMCCDVM